MNKIKPLGAGKPAAFFFIFKRITDIIFSLLFFLLLFPVFLVIAAIIMFTSPGPVLFGQRRVGFGGKEFTMYKFRSMVSNAEQLKSGLEIFNMLNGPAFKMKDDPRVTPFGRFMRKTSLDELPQLWNVLVGQMSMVGPRPPIPMEVSRYSVRQLRRLEAKPGLTCFWQINGRSNILDFEKWLKLDLEYIDKRSIAMDMKIMLMTIPAVISGFGAE